MEYKVGKRYTVLTGIIGGAVKIASFIAYLPSYARHLKTTVANFSGGWRPVGMTYTCNRKDHEEIMVEGPFDNFKKIKLKVEGAGLELTRLRVIYKDGELKNLMVKETIKRGSASHVFDLGDPGEKQIRRIEFWYIPERVPEVRARVTVFGMYPV
jgi:hypothetical protein